MVIVLIFWFISDMDVAVYRSCRPHLVWYRKICNCLPVKQNKYIQMYWPQCSYHNTLYIINSPGASPSDWPNQGPFYREVLHGVPEGVRPAPMSSLLKIPIKSVLLYRYLIFWVTWSRERVQRRNVCNVGVDPDDDRRHKLERGRNLARCRRRLHKYKP